MEEARWGLAYVLKTRFPDGYRSQYSSLSVWTDGMMAPPCQYQVVKSGLDQCPQPWPMSLGQRGSYWWKI